MTTRNDLIDVLLVRPREARRMLGCSNERLYALVNSRELESFMDGAARRITVASIKDFIARRIAADAAPTATSAMPPRRPKKLDVATPSTT